MKRSLESSSDDDEIWEEIQPENPPERSTDDQIVDGTMEGASIGFTGDLEITIPVAKKIKYTKEDWARQEELHKMHLLTLICSLQWRNQWISSPTLQQLVFESLESRIDLELPILPQLLKIWSADFKSGKVIDPDCSIDSTDKLLELYFGYYSNDASIPRNVVVMIFVCICRYFKINTRLVANLNVIPLSCGKPKTKDSRAFVLWSQVFESGSWKSVDPIAGVISDTIPVYVNSSYILAFGSDFGFTDVTKRYCPYWSRTRKKRLSTWWDLTQWLFSKQESEKTSIDHQEEVELVHYQVNEKMPTSLAAFNNHPLYALEKNLNKNEIIYPKENKHVGLFKRHLVYPRKLVRTLYTASNWIKLGRKVNEDAVPAKTLPGNGKDRELYGEWQTMELPRPDLVDGKIPRNQYGNIEIYNDRMYPIGTLHLHDAEAYYVARELKVDFVKVVVGFEYKRGAQAIPKVDGILILRKDAPVVVKKVEERKREIMEAEARRREQIVYSRWKKLIIGITNLERLKQQYIKPNY